MLFINIFSFFEKKRTLKFVDRYMETPITYHRPNKNWANEYYEKKLSK
tara:strand:+ start:310 stop:453 length:144 start_codon:yes stop_codon:yes gene_type:complete